MAVTEILTTITVAGKVVSLSRTAAKVHALLTEHPNDKSMREAGEIFDNAREIAIAEYINRREAEAKDRAAFDQAVAQMLADHQFHRLQRCLRWEAAREASDERLRLLATLAAGLCDPDMSINQKARLERAVRQLDPEDLAVLRELRERRFRSAGDQETHFARFASSTDALINTGCIRRRRNVREGGTTEALMVTELGVQLVVALEAYVPGVES